MCLLSTLAKRENGRKNRLKHRKHNITPSHHEHKLKILYSLCFWLRLDYDTSLLGIKTQSNTTSVVINKRSLQFTNKIPDNLPTGPKVPLAIFTEDTITAKNRYQ